MAEKLEDFNLPATVVQKIIKDGLNLNMNIAKDARTSLARAASIFVLYVTSHAAQVALKGSRKTLMGSDILDALESLEFGVLVPQLKIALTEYKENANKKNQNKTSPDGEDEGVLILDEGDDDEEEEVH